MMSLPCLMMRRRLRSCNRDIGERVALDDLETRQPLDLAHPPADAGGL
jgi:hypothetical protein